jgi:hypothetical protein
LNHLPLDLGDNILVPNLANGEGRTFWGFPTWRESRSPVWNAATWKVFEPNPPFAARPSVRQAYGLTQTAVELLPPQSHWYSDGAGAAAYPIPDLAEEDLVATGVRSFDVKAYDPGAVTFGASPDYFDLGYGVLTNPGVVLPTGFTAGANPTPAQLQIIQRAQAGFGHEGVMPPRWEDQRYDAQYPVWNVGFPNAAGTVNAATRRMRRTWDTWSTDYSSAPSTPLNPLAGPISGARPVYPSFPAPYPSPLRGLQIQIRVVDPLDSRLKTVTIRQDFTDKL